MVKLSRQRRWQLKNNKLGRCVSCGKPALPGQRRCAVDAQKNRRAAARWIAAHPARHRRLVARWQRAHPDYMRAYHRRWRQARKPPKRFSQKSLARNRNSS